MCMLMFKDTCGFRSGLALGKPEISPFQNIGNAVNTIVNAITRA